MDDFKLKNGSGRLCCGGCGRQNNKLNTYDWLADIPGNAEEQDMVEVQFKNTRKGYYKNSNGLHLEKGDIVAVEASPGHDIGTVTLTGRLVPLQMRKANLKPDAEIRRIYRKVKLSSVYMSFFDRFDQLFFCKIIRICSCSKFRTSGVHSIRSCVDRSFKRSIRSGRRQYFNPAFFHADSFPYIPFNIQVFSLYIKQQLSKKTLSKRNRLSYD